MKRRRAAERPLSRRRFSAAARETPRADRAGGHRAVIAGAKNSATGGAFARGAGALAAAAAAVPPYGEAVQLGITPIRAAHIQELWGRTKW